MNKYEAKWTGKYPCLCSGEWMLKKNGKDVSRMIPERLRNAPMGTRITTSMWHFENWNEVWEEVTTGAYEANWVVDNLDWLKGIGDSPTDFSAIYHAVQKEDFILGSCGGCI